MELRHSRHSVSALQYHFVFCPKYRKPLLMPGIDTKGKSSFLLRKEFPELKASIPAQLWTHSFYVASVGGTNEDVVKRYIENQRKEMKG